MKRFNWLSAGRRWRKTTLFVPIAINDILEGKTDLWCAPTYDQTMIGWEELRKAVASTGNAFTFNKSEKIVRGPNNGKLLFRSLDDPENARGHTVTGNAIFDETADIPEKAWYEIIRPMLIDSGAGLIAGGTPHGRNWFWREWTKSLNRPTDSMQWQIPTLGAEIIDNQLVRKPHPYENPDIEFSELQQMFETMPERIFKQEILAEFLENAGGVFKNINACVVNGSLELKPDHPQTHYVIGIDLAKYNDYTVCCVIDIQKRRVVDFQRWNMIDWPLQKTKIIQLAAKWNDAVIWQDSTGLGDPIFDDLSRAGLRINGFKFSQTSKRDAIEKLMLFIEQQYISFPNIPVLISELTSYEYERLPAGGLRMTAPSGMHDDCVIALALACWHLLPVDAQSHLSSQDIEILKIRFTDLKTRTLMQRVF